MHKCFESIENFNSIFRKNEFLLRKRVTFTKVSSFYVNVSTHECPSKRSAQPIIFFFKNVRPWVGVSVAEQKTSPYSDLHPRSCKVLFCIEERDVPGNGKYVGKRTIETENAGY